ncbi:MAG: 50S ribosomal protein L10 [Spirochaetales bacterium]|nr:50S ribosomal protein L10 [Spirochaetales bacterium]
MSDYAVKVNKAKEEAVTSIRESFNGVKDYIFTDYRGLSVEKITILRNKLRALDADYHVVKNNYAKIAFRDLNLDGVDPYLVGPTAIALSRGDSGAVAKELLALTKDWTLAVKGGLIDGNVFNGQQVDAFSKLPSRAELLAKLMGTMNAPMQNFVYVLNGVTTKLVRTLQAVADQKAGN